jgi:hypothetical protein
MDAERLLDGRVNLALSRREDAIVGHSLLEALYGNPRPGQDAALRFRDIVGVSVSETKSLKDERSIIRHKLFGLPPNMSDEDRERCLRATPEEPRQTGTTWNKLPKMEAGLLTDGRVSYVLARDELAIFANCVDAALEALRAEDSELGRSEYITRTGVKPEDAEEIRDELRRLDLQVRIEREPSGPSEEALGDP